MDESDNSQEVEAVAEGSPPLTDRVKKAARDAVSSVGDRVEANFKADSLARKVDRAVGIEDGLNLATEGFVELSPTKVAMGIGSTGFSALYRR